MIYLNFNKILFQVQLYRESSNSGDLQILQYVTNNVSEFQYILKVTKIHQFILRNNKNKIIFFRYNKFIKLNDLRKRRFFVIFKAISNKVNKEIIPNRNWIKLWCINKIFKLI